jgi:outer membrane protein assembly factor BamA
VNERFSEHRLQVSLDACRPHYAEQGFPKAQLSLRAEKEPHQARLTILLDIDEGPPLLISDLKLDGVTAFSIDMLLERFSVRVGQPLNSDRLGADLAWLQGQYQRAGYLTMRLRRASDRA